MKALAIFRVITLACIGFAGALFAETPHSQPLPSGPLIQLRAPEFSQWTVTYKGAAKQVKRLSVVRTQEIRHALLFDADGHQNERWCVGNMEFISDPVIQRRLAYSIGHDPDIDPELNFANSDFPGCEWISAKHYVDTRTVMGQECLFFSRSGSSAAAASQDASSGLPAGAGGTVAYVSLKTRLPVILQINGEIRVYQFEAPPQAKLTLPADIQATLEFNKKHAQELMRMPERPF